jgi:phosphoglycerate dehydrogenase-like enzyme
MSLIIASQFEDSFNTELRAHPLRPIVVDVVEDRPWEAAADADVLLVRPSPAWRASRQSARPASWPGKLKWVYSGSVGVDVYPRWLLDAPLVSCGRGIASEEIADYVIAAIYAQTKNIDAARVSSPDAWQFTATGRVVGSTVGIVGFGSIGEAVARRALALGARVTAVRRRKLPSAVDGVELLDDLTDVIASADHLVLALPSTPETRNLIDARLLAHAKPTAHVINVARGAVLDHAALLDALDDGRLAFATLDVTEPEPLPAGHPLWTHPLVRLTPHISSNYTVVRAHMYDRVAANLDRFARGLVPSDIVDAAAGY